MKFNLSQLFRFLVGGLFVFSGFVKAVDPIGTAIKLDKYYIAWSEQIATFFLQFSAISLPLSYLVVSFELVLGIFLLFNFKKKLTIDLLVGIIVFFTMLTFYTALTGQPSDCGCFGDFMVIPPWASFGKDVVLLAMILYLRKNQFDLGPSFKGLKANFLVGFLGLLTFAFSYYNIVHLPVIDFRPYKVGQDLTELVLGTPAKYEYRMKSKSDETIIQVKGLTNDIFLTHDYVDQVEVVPGEEPKVLEFRIDNEAGNNITGDILSGKKALFVVRKLEYLNQETVQRFNNYKDDLEAKGYTVYVLAGFSKQTYLESNAADGLQGQFANIDEDVSKAMIRANNGIILIEEAVVTRKRALNDFFIEEVEQ